MSISVFLDPSTMPSRTQDQSTFDANMAAYFANLPTLGQQINSTSANMNSIAAGGAYAIPYVFRSSTSSVGGLNGNLALSGGPGTEIGATSIVVDSVDSTAVAVKSRLDDVFSSSSATKGYVRLVKMGDPSKWLSFRVDSWSYTSGSFPFGSMTVSNVGSSSASPFAEGDAVMLFFQRTGDKGDNGSALMALIRDVQASGTNGAALTSATWNQRVLNTVIWNDISGASLGAGGANTFRLPAGKYVIWASAPGYTPNSSTTLKQLIRLYNRTAGTLYDVSGAETMVIGSTGGQYTTQRPALRTVLSLSSVTDFSIDHYVSVAATGGQAGGSGMSEIYTEVLIMKVS